MQSYCLDDAVFTYLISPQADSRFSQHKTILQGRYQVNYTRHTEVLHLEQGDKEILLIGLCVDSRGELPREEIPAWFLAQTFPTKEALFHSSDRMAGKYMILYRNGEEITLFGDAICSLQVNYAFQGESFFVCSVDYLLGTFCGYTVSEYSLALRKGSDASHPMPNDRTMFDEIRALLPNHYLDVGRKASIRVPLQIPAELSQDERISRSQACITTILSEYQKACPMICALTGGNDSRLVFAFLKANGKPFSCYTFFHPRFTDASPDIAIPRKLCQDYGIPYTTVADLEMDPDYRAGLEEFIGPYHSGGTMNLAATYLSMFPGYTSLSGDIAGQIGKNALGHNIPVAFATPFYFCCKLHNTAPQCREEMARYLQEIRDAGDWDHVFDLFALESRCGRWTPQNEMIYAMCSFNEMNIFNCRDVITLWMGIPRKLRTHKLIHKTILKQLDPNLLQYPVNPPKGLFQRGTAFLKKTWVGFLLMTYCKQMLLKIKS